MKSVEGAEKATESVVEPTEMEMRVAAALWNTHMRRWRDPRAIAEGAPAEFVDYARAAIRAMREPTKEMVKAADDGDDPGSSIYGDPFVPLSHDEAWRTMIDAATAPSKEPAATPEG